MASRGRTSACMDVCVSICVCLRVMARYGAFSSISHMPSLPKACGIVRKKAELKWFCPYVPPRLSLSSFLYTQTAHHISLLSVSPVHQRAVMFGVWPQSRGSQDGMDTVKNVHAVKSHFVFLLTCLEPENETILLPPSTFCTDKCVHCETRQINWDWSTSIKMRLYSCKINMVI